MRGEWHGVDGELEDAEGNVPASAVLRMLGSGLGLHRPLSTPSPPQSYPSPFLSRRQRSGALERALVGACWARGQSARLTGGVNWFGAAGWSASAKRGKGAYVRADVIAQHFKSPTSHLFLDAAVTDACSATALRAGSDRLDGKRAAELRAERKTKKYGPICDAIGSIFKAGVAERHGACCEDLNGFLKLISGDGDRDPLADDYTRSDERRVGKECRIRWPPYH